MNVGQLKIRGGHCPLCPRRRDRLKRRDTQDPLPGCGGQIIERRLVGLVPILEAERDEAFFSEDKLDVRDMIQLVVGFPRVEPRNRKPG